MDNDKKLALHVTKVHSNYNPEADAGAENKMMGEEEDVLDLGFKPFDHHFMRSFIRRAKEFEPMIEDDLQQDIVNAYVSAREDEKNEKSKRSYTTPRSLLAILRLSQAHARCRFSTKVEKQDFDEAMRLTKCSKESVELSGPAKDKNALDVVYDLLSDLVGRESKGTDGCVWLEIASVVNMAGHKALTGEQVMEALDSWSTLSVVCFNPERTMVRFEVPP